jgi:hypothetical protein
VPYLGMNKTCATVLAVDNPSRIGSRVHSDAYLE